jgi:hypothetical protein
MTGPRVEVRLPIGSGRNTFGTLIGPGFSHGDSEILLDGLKPARLVDRADWDYLPVDEQETDRG